MLRSALHAGKDVCTRLLQPGISGSSSINLQQTRSTVIVERMYPVLLAKKGHAPRLKNRNRVLRFVERVHNKKLPPITCILTDYVEGVGVEGDVVEVKRGVFRSHLQPAGLAVYASPESLQHFKEKMKDEAVDEGPKLTAFAKMTMKQLEGMFLRVPMSGDNPWILDKSHVRIAFRRSGVMLSEDCLTLPGEPITEPQNIEVSIKVNQLWEVKVKGRVYHVYKDPTKNEFHELPPLWKPTIRTKRQQRLD
ncbi:39S ribosomal protein L9, mitochondrial-like [Gigantopelta aegis]|uniref:39S ribosomal protein L9, mitochondrial-like n=1 Tax=Gigantopelta aegis TaxID=1735272 RepID=UPI001B88A405|nr:39S ribosomal protein L9, mitochondrial-like [Gigantopelta aegis]